MSHIQYINEHHHTIPPLQIPPHENFEPHRGHGRYRNRHPGIKRRSLSNNRIKTSYHWEKEKQDLLNIIRNQNEKIEHFNDLVDDLEKSRNNCVQYKLEISQLKGEIIELRNRGETEHADSMLLEKLKKSETEIGELKGKLAVDTSKLTFSGKREKELVQQNESLKTQINNLQSTIRKQTDDIAKQNIVILEKDASIKKHEGMCAKYELEIKELKEKWDDHMKEMKQTVKEKDNKPLGNQVEEEEKKAEEMLESTQPEDEKTDDASEEKEEKDDKEKEEDKEEDKDENEEKEEDKETDNEGGEEEEEKEKEGEEGEEEEEKKAEEEEDTDEES